MLGTVLIVVVIMMIIGTLFKWSHIRQRGYIPTVGLA